MGEFVRLEVEDGVGTIRLDRPKMNAINEELTRELGEAAEEAARRDDVGAVVVWGGPEVFAAGADVKMMLPMGPLEVKPMITGLQEVFNLVEEIPKVTIAAINGFALGGGCELAMCADFRYAAEDARIGQPEILLGIIPGAGGTQRLPRLIGEARAKDLIYSGRHLRAEEAKGIGLVNEVFPSPDVYSNAVEAARRYAHGPLAALRAAKIAVNWGGRGEFRAGIVLEREVFSDLFATEDQKTGMRSLLEQGPGKAKFSGR
ncbi:MAG: enoyl-CoA hydratase/isomerase family protein [Actinobacteria bacterium]|nr:MAG: enoyl-CoA hydratase/isomerase family protein [Actinomycetota bacterium]